MSQQLNKQGPLLLSDEWRDSGYILTYTGKRYYPDRPEELDVDIMDIAHALSNVCRYNGHLNTFYSVAQHSCLVARYVMDFTQSDVLPKVLALSALLHDASEAYLPDMPSPIKEKLPDFRELEGKLHKHIFTSFSLPWPYPIAIKAVDKKIREDEMRDLSDWDLGDGGIAGGLAINVQAWEPYMAKDMFLNMYEEIMAGA